MNGSGTYAIPSHFKLFCRVLEIELFEAEIQNSGIINSNKSKHVSYLSP